MVTYLNQNRHLYVTTEFKDATANPAQHVDASSNVGAIEVGTIGEGNEKEMFFIYKGVDTIAKSDRIQLKNLDYVKAIDAADLVTPLKKVKVELNPDINSGNPVSGQDYILRINLRQFYGMSDEDQYFKDVAVHATSAMSANKALFFQALKDALDKAFSREVGASNTSNPYLDFTANAANLTVTEKPQDWRLGTMDQEPVLFELFPSTIYVNGEDTVWAKQDATTGKYYTVIPSTKTVGTDAIGNGKKMANLEWFLMGERGDQYRQIGWPNDVPTKYLVNENQQYHVLEIHHAFTDTGVNSYRSEKDITIISTDKAVINKLVGAINSAANLNVATI